jgi:hypothetical protein
MKKFLGLKIQIGGFSVDDTVVITKNKAIETDEDAVYNIYGARGKIIAIDGDKYEVFIKYAGYFKLLISEIKSEAEFKREENRFYLGDRIVQKSSQVHGIFVGLHKRAFIQNYIMRGDNGILYGDNLYGYKLENPIEVAFERRLQETAQRQREEYEAQRNREFVEQVARETAARLRDAAEQREALENAKKLQNLSSSSLSSLASTSSQGQTQGQSSSQAFESIQKYLKYKNKYLKLKSQLQTQKNYKIIF